jgi:hypothetical protein
MNEIKLSPWSAKMLKQLPDKQRIVAKAVLKNEINRAVELTADTFIMQTLLILIREFGFGTTSNSTRLHRFMQLLQEGIDKNADYYEDDSIVYGLRKQLHEEGVEYALREEMHK